MSVRLFAILQKYDFSSKSQLVIRCALASSCCLRYCKSTIFQANHNQRAGRKKIFPVVCDTAKVRFFKQITTQYSNMCIYLMLFAILQKYDFSSKSQHLGSRNPVIGSCLRYCKSTIFQANHNRKCGGWNPRKCCLRYCKSTIFQANHNKPLLNLKLLRLFAILQKYDFSSKSQLVSED